MAGVVGKVDALARLRCTARPEAAHACQGAGQRRQTESGQACSRVALRGSKTVGGRGVSVAHGCLRGRRGKMALQGRGGMVHGGIAGVLWLGTGGRLLRTAGPRLVPGARAGCR